MRKSTKKSKKKSTKKSIQHVPMRTRLRTQVCKSKRNPEQNLDYDPNFWKIHQDAYEWAQETLDNFGEKRFNPETAYRKYIAYQLRRESYNPDVIFYSNFLKGQKEALEDFNPDSKIGDSFSNTNPVISDLIEILKTISLHKYSGNNAVSYQILNNFLTSRLGYDEGPKYLKFLLDILISMKFIQKTKVIGPGLDHNYENYLITSIGEEYLKTKNKARFIEFLEDYDPEPASMIDFKRVIHGQEGNFKRNPRK